MSKGRITYRLKQQRTYDSTNKSMPFKGGGVGKRKK